MRRKGTKLGEHCPKVRLSQDRMPIEPFGITGFLYVFGIFTSFGIVTYGTITWCQKYLTLYLCTEWSQLVTRKGDGVSQHFV